jgi:GT2 family glycosyltransferase
MSTQSFNQRCALPSCSIIIPTRDKLELLKPCVDSVLLSPYAGDLEILIVDNGSTDVITLSYLSSIQTDDRVTVIPWHKAFNFSEINNMAARLAQGEVLCFLNNDIEVKTPDWLERLAPVANLEQVGAVGALLLYADNLVQHAGVALDQDWVGLHIGHGCKLHELEQKYQLDRWYSAEAVTAACLLTRRQLFLDCGGFDEQQLPVSFNDVDYCLRLKKFGYLTAILPAVQLYHYESMTRKSDDLPENQPRALREKQLMLTRWQAWLGAAKYSAEIPWLTKSYEANCQNTVSDAEQIHVLSKFTGQSSLEGATPLCEDLFEDRFRLLEIDYRKLQTHTQSLEHELRLITSSRSWRLTGPLRIVFSAVTRTKQRAGLALISTKFGRKIYSLKNRSHLEQALPAPEIDVDRLKTEYSVTAVKNFSNFLDSGQTLLLPHSEKPTLSIILVLFNQAPLTLLCLESLVEHTDIDTEIIIIDNNSTDQSGELLSRTQGAKVILNGDNAGFVHAVNQGAAAAKGRYLLLLNNDALLQSGSLQAALNVFESEANVGAVGGRIRLLDGRLQEAGSIIWQDGSCLGYGRGEPPEDAQFMFRRDVDYCSGAFLMIPANIFTQLNGFDTDYAPAYYEESDFCIRIKKAGYRVVYEPDAEIIHYEFASSGGYEGASRLQQDHRKILCTKHQDFLRTQYAYAHENILKARTSSRNSRVLVIDDRVPHTTLGSGFPRCREMLHEMAEIGLQLTLYPLLVSYDEWDKTYKTLPRNVEVMLYLGRDKLAAFLSQRRGYYDFIMVSRSHNMTWFNKILKENPSLSAGAKIIYDSEAVIAPREASRLRLSGHNISAKKEQEMVAAELELARVADRIIAVSEAEANIYRNAAFTKLAVIGHQAHPKLSDKNFSERRDLLFVGALREDKSPNVDSLIWFCDEILPLIRQKLGESARLVVVGENPAPAIKRLQSQDVRFMGALDDVTHWYNHCRVFIAPTRFAAGIPHKIHEAAAHGLPVVATNLLAEQLMWTHDSELLTAATAEDFAEQCIRLYTDEALWCSVRQNAVEALVRDCSPEKFRQNLQDLFLSL